MVANTHCGYLLISKHPLIVANTHLSLTLSLSLSLSLSHSLYPLFLFVIKIPALIRQMDTNVSVKMVIKEKTATSIYYLLSMRALQ